MGGGLEEIATDVLTIDSISSNTDVDPQDDEATVNQIAVGGANTVEQVVVEQGAKEQGGIEQGTMELDAVAQRMAENLPLGGGQDCGLPSLFRCDESGACAWGVLGVLTF